MGAVTELVFDDVAPRRAMEKRRIVRRADKRVPAIGIVTGVALDGTGAGGALLVDVVQHETSPSLHTGSGCRKRHDGIFRPGVDWKHPIHPVESKIPQQPSHARSHVLEVQVMTRAV